MMEKESPQNKLIDGKWVLKRKRKRLSSGLEPNNGKEVGDPSPETLRSFPSAKQLKDESNLSQSVKRRKGNDGHYYDCVICNTRGNLLCCDSCPRTYHFRCLSPPLKRTPLGKWQCPTCREQTNSVEPMGSPDAISRETKASKNIKKRKVVTKGLHSHKGLVMGCNSASEKKKSYSKGKHPHHSTEMHAKKNSEILETNLSCDTNSSRSCRDGYTAGSNSKCEDITIEKKPSLHPINKFIDKRSRSSCKERQSLGKRSGLKLKDESSEVKSNSNNGRVGSKLLSAFDDSTQKARKRRDKCNKGDKMKKSRSEKGKRGVTTCINCGSHTSSKKHDSDGPCQSCMEVDKGGAPGTQILNNQEQNEVDRVLGCRLRNCQAISAALDHTNIDSLSSHLELKTHPVMHAAFAEPSSDVIVLENNDLLEDHPVGIEVANVDGLENSAIEDIKKEDCFVDAEYLNGNTEINTEKDHILAFEGQPLGVMGGRSLNIETRDGSSFNLELKKEKKGKMIGKNSNVELGDADVCDDPKCTTLVLSESNVSSKEKLCGSVVEKGKEISYSGNGANATDDDKQYEFLVKWAGKSNIHNNWIPESELKVRAKRKLDNYKAKFGTAVINICQEQWSRPQRIIALRVSQGNTTEVLVKWCGLPYDECTWERLDEPVIKKAAKLIDNFNQFEQRTLDMDAAPSAGMENAKGECQINEVATLVEQPKELKGGALFSHQLEALNWLRKCWHRSKNVILADEMGLGKTVSACAFMSSLYCEFKVRLPCLVLVPLSTMPNWLAEFALWAPHLNVVEYHGCAKARSMIRQYEWYATDPDGKQTKLNKFNVILTTYEMVMADASHLRGVPWEVLIVDEGHRLKNSSSKLFNLLNTFSFQHRVLLTGTPLQNNLGEMYNLLNFLQPLSFPSLSWFEEKFNDLTTAEKAEELKKIVAPHMLRRLKRDAMQNIPPKTERTVPVELSSIQAEYYRAMLTKNYQILRNVGKGGLQQSMLNIVMQLRKVCNHPYLIPGTEPESGTLEFLHEMRIKASAKLTLLHDIQAMNRAHRIGQSKRLLVYRLVVRASVEERILQLAKKKLMLDQLFVNKAESQKEVEDILRWGTEELFHDSAGAPGKDSLENSGNKTGIPSDPEQRHRRRTGGLGDVYQDRCMDGYTKSVWDESAILKLLDRSNLDLGASESTEGEVENDMLGSVKSVEWNDRDASEEQDGMDLLPNVVGDAGTQSSERKADPTSSNPDENEWDRLLRVRWEKYQNEEEAALGRGKRLRKVVSYKEAFGPNASEALSESENEEEEPKVDYSPAGRAFKMKFAKLRVRQKERIAQRRVIQEHLSASVKQHQEPEQILLSSPPPSSKVGEDHHTDANRDQITKLSSSDQKCSEPQSSDAPKDIGRVKQLNGSQGPSYMIFPCPAFPDLPPGNLSTNIFCNLPSMGSLNSVPTKTQLPVETSTCHKVDSLSKTFPLFQMPWQPNYERIPGVPESSDHAAQRMLPFHLPRGIGAGTEVKTRSREFMAPGSFLSPDASPDVMLQRWPNNGTHDSSFPSSLNPLNGRIPSQDSSGASHLAFPTKAPTPEERSLLNMNPPLSSTVSESLPFPSPSLSLGRNSEASRRLLQDLPLLPPLPNFKFQRNNNEVEEPNQQQSREMPDCSYGLGQIQATYSSLTESHKRVLENIMLRCGNLKSKKQPWSEDELDSLWIGVRRHGKGNWDIMLKDSNLGFSKHRAVEDLSKQWEMEQLKITGGSTLSPVQPPPPPPKQSDPFPAIPEEMMNRALMGSRFATPGGADEFTNPPLFRGFPTDIQLRQGGLTRGQNSSFSMPKLSRMNVGNIMDRSSKSGGTPAPELPFLTEGLSALPPLGLGDLTQKKEDKYGKLPSYLDQSLSFLRDSRSKLRNVDPPNGSGTIFPNEQDHGLGSGSCPSPMKDENENLSAKSNLPHWLREAVRPPSPPILPPTVSAIAHSVHVLYGDKQSIPPFPKPGPHPLPPKNPLRLKKKSKAHNHGEQTGSSHEKSHVPSPILSSPTSSMPMICSSGFSGGETKISLPPLGLTIPSTSVPSGPLPLPYPTDRKALPLGLGQTTILRSPDILGLAASYVTPAPGVCVGPIDVSLSLTNVDGPSLVNGDGNEESYDRERGLEGLSDGWGLGIRKKRGGRRAYQSGSWRAASLKVESGSSESKGTESKETASEDVEEAAGSGNGSPSS
ncbi:protein CHROMATIN REMODELING 4 isoform X2 [Amborella trichopoda]|uniref:protein CHROMATIN REMODELING 4 isoform X2 n=1 Tax=Amborella trichopoda TaxID=13333 RepID=UPI0009BF63B1|nr:protein CHROMATIN REMODELING 4 isoform X2 [Amborella trichopoda]|eukprot:XP_020532268.1 protein CHROMATIN REMODELING 4 isoform X2 [Amborella trichopoda]